LNEYKNVYKYIKNILNFDLFHLRVVPTDGPRLKEQVSRTQGNLVEIQIELRSEWYGFVAQSNVTTEKNKETENDKSSAIVRSCETTKVGEHD